MFGRRKRESREEVERELRRRALFEELAKRPETICPFLGLASSQIEYHTAFTREHRCYAFGEPVDLSAEQQELVCLGRGYGNCPRYLRGVLVIPTEELEALRRPLPPVRPPAPPEPPTRPSGPRRGGGGRLPLLIGLVLLLAVGATTATFLILRGNETAGNPTPTPTPSPVSSSQPSVSASATVGPQPTATAAAPSQTPFPETPKPDPTPRSGDEFIRFEVTVLQGENRLFEIDEAGNVVRERIANFSRFSKAPVSKVQAPNGLLYWRTTEGELTGLSYVHGNSGPFLIREVYRGSDGALRYLVLPDDEV